MYRTVTKQIRRTSWAAPNEIAEGFTYSHKRNSKEIAANDFNGVVSVEITSRIHKEISEGNLKEYAERTLEELPK